MKKGNHRFVLSDDSNPSASVYDSTYSIPAQRVNLFHGSSYECVGGLRDHEAVLAVNVLVSEYIYLNAWCQLRVYHSKQTDLTSVVFNYLIFSHRLANDKLLWSSQFTNHADAACPINDGRAGLTTFTCSKAVTLPSIDYRVYTFFDTFDLISSTLPSLSPYFRVQAKILNINTIQLKVETQYLRIVTSYYVYCLFIRNDLFDLTQPKPLIFVQAFYSYSNNPGSSGDFLIPFPYSISEQNMFIGIVSYKGFTSSYDFGTNTPPDSNIKGSSRIVGSALQIFALGFYSYAEVCPYYLTMSCQKCPQYCKTCHVAPSFHCFQCESGFSRSSDKLSCSCSLRVVGDYCDNFPFGCTSPKKDQHTGQMVCGSCDPTKKLNLVQGDCKCNFGYDFDTNNQCKDICGDGVMVESQCDDGNKIPGDGCNENCKLQYGFQIDNSTTSPQIKSKITLKYGIKHIFREEAYNSARLILAPQTVQKLPFQIKPQQFNPISSKIQFKIIYSQIPYKQQTIRDYWIAEINEENEITIGFKFESSIEGCEGQLKLNYEYTRYKNYTQLLTFNLRGDNYALRVSDYGATYKSLSDAMLAAIILNSICLFIGFPTNKFIGLESILTAQLIYYSQLLIFRISSWPAGFSFIKHLKHSSGFNDLFLFTQYRLFSVQAKKMHLLGVKKLLVENFNLNFLILFIVFVFSIAISIVRKHKETSTIEQLREMKYQKQEDHLIDEFTKITAVQLIKIDKINNISFRIAHQICLWLVIPLISSASTEFLIPNDQFTFIDASLDGHFLTTSRGIILLSALFMILCILLNNFKNLWLSSSSWKELMQRPEEITYKNLLFVFLFFAGIIIFFFNSKQIWSVYASVVSLVLHLLYFAGLIIIDPYKQSLRIHTVALCINNGIVLVILVFVNLLNYVQSIDEKAVLVLAIFLTFGTGLTLLLTFVRLYYEIRYGKQLEDKIMEEKEKLRLQQQKEKQLSLKNHEQKLKKEAQLKKSQQQKIRDMNTYLMENQKKQEDKVEYFEWIENRDWDQKAKDKDYFKNFDEKPLYYLKVHDQQKYEKKMEQLESKMKLQMTKRQRKLANPEYQKAVNRLRKEMEDIKQKKKSKSKSKKKKIVCNAAENQTGQFQ